MCCALGMAVYKFSQSQHTRIHDAAFTVRYEPLWFPAIVLLTRLPAGEPTVLFGLPIFDIRCLCAYVCF
jgi:hypothetical protein